MKSRLNIDGQDVGFMQELQISTNYQIADVREPGKGKGSNTKTIIIPGDPVIKKIFENIFEINSELTNFNPNLKTPAKYYVNEVLVFDGDLQLLKINNKYVNDYESTQFECSLIGQAGNFFTDIAGYYLTDIDMSDFDHPFDYADVIFTPTLGEGYVYPFIDYGTTPNANLQTNTWLMRCLKPAIFRREYVRRIFKYAGYGYNGSVYINSLGETWTNDSYSYEASGYFDSDHEKHIIIPDVNDGRLKMAPEDRADNECYIGISPDYSPAATNGTSQIMGGAIAVWTYWNNNISIVNPVPLNDEAAPYSDPNGRWDSATNYRFTANQAGSYTVYANLDVELEIVTAPAGAVTFETYVNAGYEIQLEFQLSNDGGSTWSNVGNIATNFNFSGSFASPIPMTVSGTTQLNNLISGALVRIALVQGSDNKIIFRDAGNNSISAGTSSARFNVLEGSAIQAKMTYAELEDEAGQTVRMNSTIPQNITQLDFITSIIKKENLYFEPSKTIANQYVVETREDFFYFDGSDAEDWTNKWDISMGEEIIPMGEVDWNRLRFTYKSDKDHWNQKYENVYKEVYGSEVVDIDNDFIKKENKIELVFSATPSVGSSNSSIVAPRLLSYNETTGEVKSIKCNIRALYYGGTKQCTTYGFIFGSSITYPSTYPYCGHTDDPFNPTIDLCFDNPLELYYNFPGSIYTNNGRYNERWSKQIEEITDPESKIVVRWFYLDETDISNFTFRRLVFVRDSYFIVNKIENYNPNTKSVIRAELLKLKAGSVFIPDNDINLDNLGGDTGSSTARTANTNNGTGILIGTGNYNNGIGSVIIGDNNVIG